MGYLDSAGLAHFTAWVKARLSGKQDKLPGSFGQVVGFSSAGTPEAQYLTMGQVSDGNPVGAVISFLGLMAPAGYLVCDGAAHSISDYPALADFFRQQFGAANHFGGDGTSTFAVPDMRNLFLRGYHGEAEKQLSGEIGAKQEATRQVWVEIDKNGVMSTGRTDSSAVPLHYDELDGRQGYYGFRSTGSDVNGRATYYTARPANMAVLYCVKAV